MDKQSNIPFEDLGLSRGFKLKQISNLEFLDESYGICAATLAAKLEGKKANILGVNQGFSNNYSLG